MRPRAGRDENRSRPDSPERSVFRVTAHGLVGAYAGTHEVAGDRDASGSPAHSFPFSPRKEVDGFTLSEPGELRAINVNLIRTLQRDAG